MYNNRVRSIEIPENLFSNLGEIKSKRIEKKEPEFIKNYQKNTDLKLTNYSQKNEYRDRINKMYEDIKDIIPLDNEIDDVLYFNNYVEKGIVIKPKVSSLKQFWTEYRLINNEKSTSKELSHSETKEAITLENFDDLFEALSTRVSEINKYIDELKEMRNSINITSSKLEEDKQKLSSEKQKFLDFKQHEEIKIKEQKENLKINFARLQTIIDDLDKKLESIDQ